jgi:NAD(P)-dependent dehydrogenase (short-subunit alcohol dehydrogenase family)
MIVCMNSGVKDGDRARATLSGFEGRVALVTGGARGIGRRTSELLRDLGATVAAADLTTPEITGVLGFAMDVANEAAVEDGFTVLERTHGPVSLLVLNAGILKLEGLEATTLDSWQTTLDVNLTGAFLVARRALPSMRASGYGRIVGIASSAAKTGGASPAAAYAASKAGLAAMLKAIAVEYAPHGITANSLAPALIETEMMRGVTQFANRIPVGRTGTPDDVAWAIAYLCSEESGYVTAEVIDVNGGFLID